jgi:adenosine deaminase CECR1
MILIIYTLAIISFVYGQGNCNNIKCYEKERQILVDYDEKKLIGNNETMNEKEKTVEKILFHLRNELIYNFFDPPLSQRNWREIADMAKQTQLYKFMKIFPKGASLHVHGFCNAYVVIKSGTYDPTCYVDLRNDSSTYGFFRYSNTSIDGWTNTVKARYSHKELDLMLWNFTQFWTPKLHVNETEMWKNFDLVIKRLESLMENPSVVETCLMDTFKRLTKEGIQHLELRIPLNPNLISLITEMLGIYNSYGNNLTVRYIIEHVRSSGGSEDVYPTMVKTVDYMNTNKLVVGFDLVGEEDMGLTLHDYAQDFINIYNYANSNNYGNLKYVFHCAETDNVTRINSNVFDAVLLGSLRLGHALGLRNHPGIINIIKKQGVGLEICPVSNQLLRYFSDIRTHPGSEYIARGLPVTLNSDDPDIYGYESPAPTPDYFMGFLSWDLSLISLKEIAENSIIYSSLDINTKREKLIEYQSLYNIWINTIYKYWNGQIQL